MPSIYDLKPRFQQLLRPLVRLLARIGVTANQVTLTAVVLSISAGALVALNPGQNFLLLVIPLVLFIRMALNAIDGMLAREFDQKSSLGAILNELGDVLSDAALYLPLALIPDMPSSLIVVCVLFAVISEMTGVVAVQIGAQRMYQGPMGKSDRAFVFGLLALLLGLNVPIGLWVEIVFYFMLALLVLTIVNRSRSALQEVNEWNG